MTALPPRPAAGRVQPPRVNAEGGVWKVRVKALALNYLDVWGRPLLRLTFDWKPSPTFESMSR